MHISNKPIVAHINFSFFAKSETFIYQYVSNLNKFYPIYLANEFVNLDQFYALKQDMYKITINRYTFKWFFYGVLRKYFGIDIIAERIMKERNVKLIHAHFGPNGVNALRFKKKWLVPLITTLYGYDISKLAKIPEWSERYRVLFLKGDLFLVEGPYMKSKLMDLGCPEQKIKIQRIAISLERTPFKPRKPKKDDEKVILIFAGRFVEKKGLIYALHAIKKVKEKYKSLEFCIIGDGPLKQEIEQFIRDHRMDDYVKMFGFLTYENYLKEMQKADIFIHPSITASDGDSEGGAPTSILEAQAAGMPVVSTYHADIPNIVVPGKSALLSNERDWQSLSQNITYLLENQHIWKDMGKAGHTFVKKYHDIGKEVNILEDRYNLLINNTKYSN